MNSHKTSSTSPLQSKVWTMLWWNRTVLCFSIHWGRMMHICVSKLTIIGSDNGLSPGRRQAIIWANAGILLIEPFGTKFSEILIEIQTFSSKKMHLKMSSAKWQPICLGLRVLTLEHSVWHRQWRSICVGDKDVLHSQCNIMAADCYSLCHQGISRSPVMILSIDLVML